MPDDMQEGTAGAAPASSGWQLFWTSEAPRRIAVTIAALSILGLGLQIPAFHISTASLGVSGGLQNWPELISRLSYFAIGITPVINVLIVAEIFKLAFSDVRDWTRDAASRAAFNRVVVVLSLLLATLQGYGISLALEQANGAMQNSEYPLLLETGPQVRAAFVASVVAATALSIWLADQITRHGLGSGIWSIYLIGPVISLSSMPADLGSRIQLGELAPSAVVFTAAVLVASLAAVVTLTRLWLQWAETDDAQPSELRPDAIALSIVVWPPLLASGFLGMLYWFAGGFNTSTEPSNGQQLKNVVVAILGGLLIWLFTALMVRTFPALKARDPMRTRVLAGLTVLVSFGLTVALEVFIFYLGVPVSLNAPTWIAIAALMAVLLPRDLTPFMTARSANTPLTDADFEQR